MCILSALGIFFFGKFLTVLKDSCATIYGVQTLYILDLKHIAANITWRSGQEAKKSFALKSFQSTIFQCRNVKFVKKTS